MSASVGRLREHAHRAGRRPGARHLRRPRARHPGLPRGLLDRRRVAGYLCDRGTTAAWFAHRRHHDGRAALRSRSRRAALALRPAPGMLHARMRLPGGPARAVTLTRVTGRAGIYRATAATGRGGLEAGWIVLGDGSQRAAATPFMGKDIELSRPTEIAAAPRLDTATGHGQVGGGRHRDGAQAHPAGLRGEDHRPLTAVARCPRHARCWRFRSPLWRFPPCCGPRRSARGRDRPGLVHPPGHRVASFHSPAAPVRPAHVPRRGYLRARATA
jgi:hypothetical protein